MAYSYEPYRPNGPDLKSFDIGVIIALPEELDYFLEELGSTSLFKKPDPKPFWVEEVSFTKFELVNLDDDENIIQVVVTVVGEMGNEYTGIATKIMVEKWHLPFIVNIGVTGSLDKDLQIGSVLIPSQITQYTANGKAKLADNGVDTEIMFGTRAFATSRLVLNQFNSFISSKECVDWKESCITGYEGVYTKPNVVVGHLASGNMVVDSLSYQQLLKKTDRKLMACEMEAAGFAIAEHFLQSSARAISQFICLRCISDMANHKDKVENSNIMTSTDLTATTSSSATASITPKKLPRNWAMCNATKLFLILIKHQVINANLDDQLQRIEALTKDLKDKKKDAKSRPMQACNATVESLLAKIELQKDVKTLGMANIENIHKLLDHFEIRYSAKDSNNEKMKVLKDHLRVIGHFKLYNKSNTTTPNANNSAFNVDGDEDGDDTAGDVKDESMYQHQLLITHTSASVAAAVAGVSKKRGAEELSAAVDMVTGVVASTPINNKGSKLIKTSTGGHTVQDVLTQLQQLITKYQPTSTKPLTSTTYATICNTILQIEQQLDL